MIAPNMPETPSAPPRPRVCRSATLLAALWLGMLLFGASEPDQAILRSVHVTERPWVVLVLAVTELGAWAILLALPFLAGALLAYRRQRHLAIFVIASPIAGRLLVEAQKAVMGRLRPEQDNPMVIVESFAYPSGHAANSMIVYLLLALLLVDGEQRRRWAIAAAVALSVAIGVTRVLLGVHWPSDVIGGWAFGLMWVLFSWRYAYTLKRISSTSPSWTT